MSNEYKLVPVVPTESMWEAVQANGFEGQREHFEADWAAALQASPAHDGEVASWQYRYMLGNTGIWSEWEQTASESSAKGIVQKHALHKLSAEYRATYTAPPRVVDDELRKVVAAHIADLRRCVPIYHEHGLHTVGKETSLAADELQAALEKQ